ncbi:cyclin-domain-containing protein [Umbelopsis sp. PMI_123]|nr:cyclin-domain-containing protein [Umbelopsis sp. PMI_123]
MAAAHFDLAAFPTTETIKMLTNILVKITRTNDRLCNTIVTDLEKDRPNAHAPIYTCFHARSIPTIDIHSYLSRILKYTPCANEVFLSLLVYFDRMSRNDSNLRIDSFNIHRLIIAGVTVASKYFSDVFFTNSRYAKVGGLPPAELNTLELEFLHLNNFNLSVSIEELQQYGDQLLNHCLREDEMKRQAKAESSGMIKIAPTILPSTNIKDAPPDTTSQNELQNKRSSKTKTNSISNDSDARPRMTTTNTDTSPKWANGRYVNSMRNVDTQRHHDIDGGDSKKIPYHRTSEPKYRHHHQQSSTPSFSASRRLDALLDASLTSNGDKKSQATDIDHYLPTPPNSVSPQFQSHQPSSLPGSGLK